MVYRGYYYEKNLCVMMTFDMCREYVDEVVTVSEGEIAMSLVLILVANRL